jgi:hypothetical protein
LSGSGRIGREGVSIGLTDEDIGWRAVYLPIVGDCLVPVSRCRGLEGDHCAGVGDFPPAVAFYVWHGDEHLRIRGVSVGFGSACIGASNVLIAGLGKRFRSGNGRIVGGSVPIKAGGVVIEPEDGLIKTESVCLRRRYGYIRVRGVHIRVVSARTNDVGVGFRAADVRIVDTNVRIVDTNVRIRWASLGTLFASRPSDRSAVRVPAPHGRRLRRARAAPWCRTPPGTRPVRARWCGAPTAPATWSPGRRSP